jgi:hypothetical protein
MDTDTHGALLAEDAEEHVGHGLKVPEAVKAAEEGRVTEPGEVEIDATAWLMDSDAPTADELQPTVLRLNVGTPDAKKIVEWHIVPLPEGEFRKFRQAAMPRAARRGGAMNLSQTDDGRYHRLVVTAATVYPNLREIAEKKGIADPAEIVRHRFAAKPGLVAQISGYVSDISGFDESDVEVVAGNS